MPLVRVLGSGFNGDPASLARDNTNKKCRLCLNSKVAPDYEEIINDGILWPSLWIAAYQFNM